MMRTAWPMARHFSAMSAGDGAAGGGDLAATAWYSMLTSLCGLAPSTPRWRSTSR